MGDVEDGRGSCSSVAEVACSYCASLLSINPSSTAMPRQGLFYERGS